MTPEIDSEFQKAIQAARSEGYAKGYAAAEREWRLKMADEMNDLLGAAIRKNRDFLQSLANDLGREIHTAVPGVSVKPYKNAG